MLLLKILKKSGLIPKIYMLLGNTVMHNKLINTRTIY